MRYSTIEVRSSIRSVIELVPTIHPMESCAKSQGSPFSQNVTLAARAATNAERALGLGMVAPKRSGQKRRFQRFPLCNWLEPKQFRGSTPSLSTRSQIREWYLCAVYTPTFLLTVQRAHVRDSRQDSWCSDVPHAPQVEASGRPDVAVAIA
jgi:hypothetical protein